MLLASKIKLQVCNLICMDILQDPLEVKGLAQTRVSWSFGRRCWCWKAASTCPDSRMQLLKLILCSGYKWLCLEQDLKDQKEISGYYIFFPENSL